MEARASRGTTLPGAVLQVRGERSSPRGLRASRTGSRPGTRRLISSLEAGPVELTHRLDLVPLRVQGPPDEDHDAGRRGTSAVVEDLGHLGDRDLLAPVGELDDRPDPDSFAGHAPD